MFPISQILDNFNRANENPLTGDWVNGVFVGQSGLRVVSNQVSGNDAVESSSYWGQITTTDCESFVSLPVLDNAKNHTLLLRLQEPGTVNVSGYAVRFLRGGGPDRTLFYRIDNGVLTQLGSYIEQEFSPGDALGAEMVGTSLNAYRYNSGAWQLLGSRTDATYQAAGYIGLMHNDDNQRSDDFGGGPFSVEFIPEFRFVKRVKRQYVPDDWDSQDGFCILSLSVPNSPLWRAVVNGAISQLINPAMWDADTGDTEEAAKLAYVILDSIVSYCP